MVKRAHFRLIARREIQAGYPAGRPLCGDPLGLKSSESIPVVNGEVESSQYDIGSTSIRLVRVGSVIQILFSSPLEAGYLYRELAERYKRAEEKVKGERS